MPVVCLGIAEGYFYWDNRVSMARRCIKQGIIACSCSSWFVRSARKYHAFAHSQVRGAFGVVGNFRGSARGEFDDGRGAFYSFWALTKYPPDLGQTGAVSECVWCYDLLARLRNGHYARCAERYSCFVCSLLVVDYGRQLPVRRSALAARTRC